MYLKKGPRLSARWRRGLPGEAEQHLCEACQGRGWVYVRAYEACPDCNGAGGWAESTTAEASDRKKSQPHGPGRAI
ncbi:MAG TPA: hypothetical protein VJ436_12650 [Anaerolineales bacterium]|nr:hypothetical protein [Anaerolineales bacterium]